MNRAEVVICYTKKNKKKQPYTYCLDKDKTKPYEYMKPKFRKEVNRVRDAKITKMKFDKKQTRKKNEPTTSKVKSEILKNVKTKSKSREKFKNIYNEISKDFKKNNIEIQGIPKINFQTENLDKIKKQVEDLQQINYVLKFRKDLIE